MSASSKKSPAVTKPAVTRPAAPRPAARKPAARTRSAAPAPAPRPAKRSAPAALPVVPNSAASAPSQPKPIKPRKEKPVRDSFTFPKAEYAVIDQLKQRSERLGERAKKSELLRAGIKALSGMSDSQLAAALQAVPTLKTGRPAKT